MDLKRPALLQSANYINGQWHTHASVHFEVKNPASGDVLAEIPECGEDETRAAIDAANVALPQWSALTAGERATILKRWHALIIANQQDLAKILTAEQGKPIAEASAEIAYGASYIEWFAEEAKRIYGDIIPPPDNNKRLMVVRQPIGVVAAITPWNFPNAMIARKLAPALAAGCTVVAKPATETPLSAIALAVLAEEAGVPAGVLNIVCGSKASAIGGEMTRNDKVRKLSFTGSTPIGKLLLSQCAATVKKTSMELGGNAPFIVFDDADLDEAIAGVMASKFRNAGQTCVCSNRILIQSGIYDRFVEKLTSAVKNLKIGSGFDPVVSIGPLINQAAALKVSELVDDALAKGAKPLIGGKLAKEGSLLFEPTVLGNANIDMLLYREEIFGPVAPLFRFNSEEEAIAMANDTEFGLAAYFYTRDLSRVFRLSEALEYGIVGVNEGIVSNAAAPFGGIKESGSGREGSKYGIDDYLEMKYICLSGI